MKASTSSQYTKEEVLACRYDLSLWRDNEEAVNADEPMEFMAQRFEERLQEYRSTQMHQE